MSKENTKATPLDTAKAWVAKHSTENLDLKALNSAVAALEKRTFETQAAAAKLGEALEARKSALKDLKSTLKKAKDARKHPKKQTAKAVTKASAPKKAAAKKPSTPTLTWGRLKARSPQV